MDKKTKKEEAAKKPKKATERQLEVAFELSERYNNSFDHYEVVTSDIDAKDASYIINQFKEKYYLNTAGESVQRFPVKKSVFQTNKQITYDPNSYREEYIRLKGIKEAPKIANKIAIAKEQFIKAIYRNEFASATVFYLTFTEIDKPFARTLQESQKEVLIKWKKWVKADTSLKEDYDLKKRQDKSWIPEEFFDESWKDLLIIKGDNNEKISKE